MDATIFYLRNARIAAQGDAGVKEPIDFFNDADKVEKNFLCFPLSIIDSIYYEFNNLIFLAQSRTIFYRPIFAV